MLRALVALFVLLNAAVYFWLHAEPRRLEADRDPQRLQHQVAPDAIHVLPDLPASSSSAATSAADVRSRLVGGRAPSGGTGPRAAALLAVDVECAESDPLSDVQLAALERTLTHAGVPADTLSERRDPQAVGWMIYMGHYADARTLLIKADELKRLNVRFDRVDPPDALAPGLSLGTFATQGEANAHLLDLRRRGVRTGHVVDTAASGSVRLQVRTTDPGWRVVVGTQRFGTCPASSSSVSTAGSSSGSIPL